MAKTIKEGLAEILVPTVSDHAGGTHSAQVFYNPVQVRAVGAIDWVLHALPTDWLTS